MVRNTKRNDTTSGDPLPAGSRQPAKPGSTRRDPPERATPRGSASGPGEPAEQQASRRVAREDLGAHDGDSPQAERTGGGDAVFGKRRRHKSK
jgi:hypothetical protein